MGKVDTQSERESKETSEKHREKFTLLSPIRSDTPSVKPRVAFVPSIVFVNPPPRDPSHPDHFLSRHDASTKTPYPVVVVVVAGVEICITLQHPCKNHKLNFQEYKTRGYFLKKEKTRKAL